MTTVASTGPDSGMIMFQKMRNGLAPSIRAASSSSSGMVMKNWRNRKMEKALPPAHEGTIRG